MNEENKLFERAWKEKYIGKVGNEKFEIEKEAFPLYMLLAAASVFAGVVYKSVHFSLSLLKVEVFSSLK